MDGTERRRLDPAGLIIAGALLVIAGLIWWDVTSLTITSVYGPGPKTMPTVIASGVALLALGNAFLAFRGELPRRESLDFRPILLILGGFLVLMALVAWGGGFIIATAVLFATTSAAFGRRAFLTDLLIGLVAGLLIYLLFAKLLSLTLPIGPLERLI
jgi:putative tricarboxylic transport membrane protein